LAGAQKDFPVKRGDAVVGMLTADRLLAGLRKNGETGPVSAWMLTEFPSADINESVEAVLARIQDSQYRIVVVHDGNGTVGLVDMDNLLEWINISNAIHHRA
jgi:predicted transcriptional regulator